MEPEKILQDCAVLQSFVELLLLEYMSGILKLLVCWSRTDFQLKGLNEICKVHEISNKFAKLGDKSHSLSSYCVRNCQCLTPGVLSLCRCWIYVLTDGGGISTWSHDRKGPIYYQSLFRGNWNNWPRRCNRTEQTKLKKLSEILL